MAKRYCIKCKKDVDYKIVETRGTITLPTGKDVEEDWTDAQCEICGTFICIPEIVDENLERIYKKHNCI